MAPMSLQRKSLLRRMHCQIPPAEGSHLSILARSAVEGMVQLAQIGLCPGRGRPYPLASVGL